MNKILIREFLLYILLIFFYQLCLIFILLLFISLRIILKSLIKFILCYINFFSIFKIIIGSKLYEYIFTIYFIYLIQVNYILIDI